MEIFYVDGIFKCSFHFVCVSAIKSFQILSGYGLPGVNWDKDIPVYPLNKVIHKCVELVDLWKYGKETLISLCCD